MALYRVHFDGAITHDHKVSVRILANTYEHMQRSIDRAYLINKHGQVWKNARLKGREYDETEFIAEYPVEGGIILDAVRNGADRIIDRIANAVYPVFEAASEEGVARGDSLASQYHERIEYVQGMARDTQSFESVLARPPQVWARAYSNRSIVKEIDPMVGVISRHGGSVELQFKGSETYPRLLFTPRIAKNFHSIVAQRALGTPMVVNARIRSLDRGNRNTMPSAKIENVRTGREVVLKLMERQDVEVLHPVHDGREVQLYVAPITEALGFDMYGGDLLFLDLV